MGDDFILEPEEAPTGYISAESKKKFTITAGILGALFFIAQFVAPFIVMVGIMVVALSENWQRVSDMAARTVVVRTKKIK